MTLAGKGLLKPFSGVQMKKKFPTGYTHFCGATERVALQVLRGEALPLSDMLVFGDTVFTSDFHVGEEIFAARPICQIKRCALNRRAKNRFFEIKKWREI